MTNDNKVQIIRDVGMSVAQKGLIVKVYCVL